MHCSKELAMRQLFANVPANAVRPTSTLVGCMFADVLSVATREACKELPMQSPDVQRAMIRNILRELAKECQTFADASFNADNPQFDESPTWILEASEGVYITGFNNTMAAPTIGSVAGARTFNSKADAERYAAKYCTSISVSPVVR
jgi:hypothetical protein